MRLIDLILVIIVTKLLKNKENQKVKSYLNSKNWLSQEKSCQKVGIYLILMLKKLSQAF